MKTLLYAPEEFWEIPPDILESVIGRGGCGPGKIGDRLVPDNLLGLSILWACKIHDYMWEVGCTEEDRREADRVFLNNMLRLVDSADSMWLVTVIRRRMALFYYRKVANYGSIFYWRGKNPLNTMQEVVG